MNAVLIILGCGSALSGLLGLALRYGSTRITLAPVGACLCPEHRPPTGELTAAAAAALHDRHRFCPACPSRTLARDYLDAAHYA